jgi:hypothetical protein
MLASFRFDFVYNAQANLHFYDPHEMNTSVQIKWNSNLAYNFNIFNI